MIGGAVTLRPQRADDTAVLVAARDDASRPWLGAGSGNPSPTACIVVGAQVAAWVGYDHDADHDWLGDREVNIGYLVFAEHRSKGLCDPGGRTPPPAPRAGNAMTCAASGKDQPNIEQQGEGV